MTTEEVLHRGIAVFINGCVCLRCWVPMSVGRELRACVASGSEIKGVLDTISFPLRRTSLQ